MSIKQIKKVLLLTLAAPILTFSMAGCWEKDSKNAADDMGEKIENTAESAGDAMEEGAENAADAVEDAAEKVEETMDNPE